MFDDLRMIAIQIRIEQIQIRTPMTQEELVYDLWV